MTIRPFDTTELQRMRSTQQSAMQDRCDLYHRTETDRADDYGTPVAQWLVSELVECGLEPGSGRDVLNAEAPRYDARLRLPITTDVTNLDRVTITHRYGEMLETPVQYQVIGSPRRGPSGLVLMLENIP